MTATKTVYAVCPRCYKRAVIVSHRWDWDRDQDYAVLKCGCGRSEVPFDEGRVLDIDLNNPYMEETHFKLLIPQNYDYDGMWNKIGGCLMASGAEKG